MSFRVPTDGPGHCTETALVKMKDDLDPALDREEGLLLVLLDFGVAFDTTDHTILLDRLEQSCSKTITGPARGWISSHLGGTAQDLSGWENLSPILKAPVWVCPSGICFRFPVVFSLLLLCWCNHQQARLFPTMATRMTYKSNLSFHPLIGHTGWMLSDVRLETCFVEYSTLDDV